MIYVWSTLMAVVNAGWLLLTLVGMPGNWLMIATAALYEVLYAPSVFSTGVFVAAVGMAGLGELAELLAGMIGSRRGGASRKGSLGALFGGIAGAILGTALIPVPVLGTILGAAMGAFLVSATIELAAGRPQREAVRAGRGAAVGHVTGNLLKFLLGCGVWVTLAVAAFAG